MFTGRQTPGCGSPLQKRHLARSNKDSIVLGLRLTCYPSSSSVGGLTGLFVIVRFWVKRKRRLSFIMIQIPIFLLRFFFAYSYFGSWQQPPPFPYGQFKFKSTKRPGFRRFRSPPLSRTWTNTNTNDTEANAAGRSGNARALRKQCKCGMIQEGEGIGQIPRKFCKKARYLWVLRFRRTIKRKAREQRSSWHAEHKVHSAEVKVCHPVSEFCRGLQSILPSKSSWTTTHRQRLMYGVNLNVLAEMRAALHFKATRRAITRNLSTQLAVVDFTVSQWRLRTYVPREEYKCGVTDRDFWCNGH